jgi:hypothetical protein
MLTDKYSFVNTSKIIPPDLLRLFVYVLHTEMLDCFENHSLRVSKFVMQKRRSVVTYISLRSWSLEGRECGGTETVNASTKAKKSKHGKRHHVVHSLSSEEFISLPESLRKAFDKNNELDGQDDHCFDEPPCMELKVSSIGISTNSFGDYSKCTVTTDLLEKSDKAELGHTLQKIWDDFVHQPQSGRFVVFAVVLSSICREIARSYDNAIREFVRKFKFDNLSVS